MGPSVVALIAVLSSFAGALAPEPTGPFEEHARELRAKVTCPTESAPGNRLVGPDEVAASWRPFVILLGPEPAKR